MTKRYYIAAALTAPILSALVVTSSINIYLAAILGAISQVGLTLGGYYLGRRDNPNESTRD